MIFYIIIIKDMYSLCTYLSAAVITVTHIYTVYIILYIQLLAWVAQYSQWKYMVYSITLHQKGVPGVLLLYA